MEYKNIDPEKTGKFIRKLRKQHNWSQIELGAKIFISFKSISKWETGRCCPSIDMIKRLSEALGVTIDDLIAGDFVSSSAERKALVNLSKKKKIKLLGISTSFLIIVAIIIMIISKNATKVFTINYEDENFVIENGMLVLGSESYFNLGRFRVDIGVDLKDLNFILYEEKGNEKFKIFDFTYNETVLLTKDVKELLMKFVNYGYVKNLSLEIYYFNDYDEEISYNLKIEPILSRSSEPLNDNSNRNGVVRINEYSKETEIDFDGNLSLEFLYDINRDYLAKCLNGKKISIDSNSYKFSYDSKDETLVIESKDTKIIIYFKAEKVFVENNGLESNFVINNYKHIEESYVEANILNILSRILNEIKSLCYFS